MELSSLLLLLLPCFCFSQEKIVKKSGGIELRIPSFCETTSGERGQFPFIFKGQRYTKCTFANSPTPWCATMVDQNDNAVTNRWGDCSITGAFSSCETDTPKQSSCITNGGPTPNKPCIFPFRFNGVTHTSCTSVNINQPWCSTATRSDGSHITGQYGLCPSTCSGSGGKLIAPQQCTPGSTWTENCNTCICKSTGQPSCTTNNPGSSWKDDCNTCVCSSAGQAVCTEKVCSATTSCRVTSGPATGRQCAFPFTYNGKTHQGCTPWTFGGTNQGKNWCSTKTDGQGSHLNGGGNYGFCSQDCPASTAGEGFIKSRFNLERRDGIVFEEETNQAPS